MKNVHPVLKLALYRSGSHWKPFKPFQAVPWDLQNHFTCLPWTQFHPYRYCGHDCMMAFDVLSTLCHRVNLELYYWPTGIWLSDFSKMHTTDMERSSSVKFSMLVPTSAWRLWPWEVEFSPTNTQGFKHIPKMIKKPVYHVYEIFHPSLD